MVYVLRCRFIRHRRARSRCPFSCEANDSLTPLGVDLSVVNIFLLELTVGIELFGERSGGILELGSRSSVGDSFVGESPTCDRVLSGDLLDTGGVLCCALFNGFAPGGFDAGCVFHSCGDGLFLGKACGECFRGCAHSGGEGKTASGGVHPDSGDCLAGSFSVSNSLLLGGFLISLLLCFYGSVTGGRCGETLGLGVSGGGDNVLTRDKGVVHLGQAFTSSCGLSKN